MRTILSILFLLSSATAFPQALKNLTPTPGKTLDFSPRAQKEWETRDALLTALARGDKKWEALTPLESALLEKYGETEESMWDVEGAGCSWYCGGGPKNVTASSSLAAQGDNVYAPFNAHDLNYRTAWVEGAKGYGIGEYLEYEFSPESPRINTIKVVNGYVKSDAAWKNNSRVKKLKVYVDGAPYAVLNLEDIVHEQVFDVGILGYGDRDDYERLKKKPDWKLRFEIVEVYKGDKYDDVAITEIFFDGLDVHCFAAGTKVTMADGSLKNIELLTVGEEVLSYNQATGVYEAASVLSLASPAHSLLVKISFENGKFIVMTPDHPLFDGSAWYSCDPGKTRRDYLFDEVGQLVAGQLLGDFRVTAITPVEHWQETYTIVRLSRNNVFIAEGMLVGTGALRHPEMVALRPRYHVSSGE